MGVILHFSVSDPESGYQYVLLEVFIPFRNPTLLGHHYYLFVPSL